VKVDSGGVCFNPPCLKLCSENANSTFFNETTNDFQVTHPLNNETSVFKGSLLAPCQNLLFVPNKMKAMPENEWKFFSVSLQREEKKLRKFSRKTFFVHRTELFL
jgi:hypothetical protein